jgi:O-antigen/teichoic acid export membrane protein
VTEEYRAGAAVHSQVGVGVRWKLLSMGYSQIVRLVSAVVIAHALTPHEYGLAGLALVLTALVVIFSDLAFGTALIQRWRVTEGHRSSVFWLTTAAGLVFTLVGIALSGPAASFYDEPRLRGLFAVLSLSFFLTSLGATHYALLTRDMAYRQLELRQIGVVTVGALVGISCAVAGLGAWAIVSQQLALAAASTLFVWAFSHWHPRFRVSLTALRELARFSWNIFSQRMVAYADQNVASLVIGRTLGASALGTFTIGFNVMLAPLARVAYPMQDVLFPALTRLQDDPERLANAWIRALRLVAAVTTPAMLGVIVVAPEFVHVMLGPQWLGSVVIIQILAWVGLHQSLQSLNSIVLQSRDRTGDLLRWSLLSLAVDVGAVVIGLHWGVVGVAAAIAVGTTLIAPVYLVMTTRCIGLSPWKVLHALAGVIEASALMAAGVWVARQGLLAAGAGPVLRFGGLVTLGACLQLSLLWILARPTFDDAIGLLEPLRRMRRPLAARTAA